jgi:hypothetical protein
VKGVILLALAIGTLGNAPGGGAAAIRIDLTHDTDNERQTRSLLEQLLSSYDLTKYTFTNRIVIEERAINHAFPTLTLNVRFRNSGDELLSSYIHEQYHWYLRNSGRDQQDAIAELRRMYPGAPVGGTEGADSAVSTYGHLVDCYLEILADRKLIGPERTTAVIDNKGHYTWIYKTVVQDESRIAAVVRRHHLEHT